MKYKNVITTLFIVACSYVQAQDITLDGQKAVVAGPGKVQTISDILPMGNWLPNKALDSLKVGDTLVLTNDNTIRETDLNFSKEGKVTRYTQHMQTTHQKDGGNSIDIMNSWDDIGQWKDNNEGTFFDLNPDSQVTVREIGKSYSLIKLIVLSHLVKAEIKSNR